MINYFLGANHRFFNATVLYSYVYTVKYFSLTSNSEEQSLSVAF
jgi:hypothetical protein